MKRLLNYATFYTTSNRAVSIIIIIMINLLGSHWFLSVSVLEVKLCDWSASQGHQLFVNLWLSARSGSSAIWFLTFTGHT